MSFEWIFFTFKYEFIKICLIFTFNIIEIETITISYTAHIFFSDSIYTMFLFLFKPIFIHINI